jgi:sulfhydrogenase subunit beta (sulfur reductase)
VAGSESLGRLISCLQQRGYEVVGPRVRDGAIVHDKLEKLEDLPEGWTDEQAAGQYRLERRDDRALFRYNLGAHGWKRFLYPSEVRLLRAGRDEQNFRILNNRASEAPPKMAFLGVRACDLAAIAIQDRVLLGDRYVDPIYQGRRNGVFIVAVQCTQASSNCFCASMGTGPKVQGNFDLAVTEVGGEDGLHYVVEIGTEAGAEVLQELVPRPASAEEIERAEDAVKGAARMIARHMDVTGIRELLYDNFEHSRWDDAAGRCLSCGNCTLVCPTCFCSTVEDASDVTGEYAERWRRWDSCFVQNFSYIHGGSVRMSVRSRYRQWLTHKLAAWIDQFGTSGCVGCGRCITWCPVGIDITQEVSAIRTSTVAEGDRLNEGNQSD